MNDRTEAVHDAGQLGAAVRDPTIGCILVAEDIAGLATLRLSPGQTLRSDTGRTLRFAALQDGLQLTSDNAVQGLAVATDTDRRAIFNDTTVAGLGNLQLRALRVTGCVRLVAGGAVRSGHLDVQELDIKAADARGWNERPAGFGVEVVPGAFTLWNQQNDRAVTITADLTGISAGRPNAPVRGSGVFVSGCGAAGGQVLVSRLETNDIHSDGGIAPGTPDRISGSVFTVTGVVADRVHTRGTVTTYGPNDMALDNWGAVESWEADGKITSFGPSGIGFVNFGSIGTLRVTAPIETFGKGARGFNVYAGTIQTAEFDRITTHADGAVGIQIGRPVGKIVVRRGIETNGAVGESLVEGVVMQLPATALSVKPEGAVDTIEIGGGVVANGPDVEPLELRGIVGSLTITGGVRAAPPA